MSADTDVKDESSDKASTPAIEETYIVFVRHAKTASTGKILPGRTSGLHLSEEGRQQAKAVAKVLQNSYPSPAAIYTSPLERAQETARPYVESLAATPEVITSDAIVECDFGEWTGRDLKDLYKLPEWQIVQRHPSKFRFPSGESFQEMQSRIVAFETECDKRYNGQVVVAFSHADTIKTAVVDALGMHLDQFQRIQIDTASVSVIGIIAGVPRLICMNSGSELPRKVSTVGA
ncbi:probable phosphoglycerate mutase [Ferrithrix thermotolerans DSM 19514]|uniref:Probable phosphoglycerate mutase n=1 Tax=Ferrithrix thermotolerans DSM 19514 TaxID=1121881 RepID=A0A1M4U389_9ACTN|nr:histidine phosphatase family protein [Ferrithrix thermotolerans]SHE51182.1 probable phosphoglycerate mutase [Ferrithrix thermotolerans DSM 19514]